MSKKERKKDKTMSKKDQYVEKVKAKFDKWNAELDDLEAKFKEAGADAKSDYEEHLKALRQHRDKAKVKLAEIQGANEDTWEALKDGLEDIGTALKEGFEKVKSKFK